MRDVTEAVFQGVPKKHHLNCGFSLNAYHERTQQEQTFNLLAEVTDFSLISRLFGGGKTPWYMYCAGMLEIFSCFFEWRELYGRNPLIITSLGDEKVS